MAAVSITAVNVLDNPAPFTNPLQFEVHYECLTDLQEDLEWKIVYVGSADSEKYDQVLDCVMVGPVVAGKFKFVFQAPAPNPDDIPKKDIFGITAVLLTCSYKGSEFLRVGYYVNNAYEDEELNEKPPDEPIISQLIREIDTKNPRVTRFANNFDEPPAELNGGEEGEPMEGEGDELELEGDEDEGEEEGDEDAAEEDGGDDEREGEDDDMPGAEDNGDVANIPASDARDQDMDAC